MKEMQKLPLFKVLVDGKPCHGGAGAYPKSGQWTTAIKDCRCCVSGYHLTSDPLIWWKPRATLWFADYAGTGNANRDKVAYARVRLIGRVTRKTPGLGAYPRLRAFLAASDRSINPKADVTWASLSRADLGGANLFGADLSGADLFGANLSVANLSEANLSGANLSEANLSGANLSGADLSRARLSGTNLSRADLGGANLNGTNLSMADLGGANLNGADLIDCLGYGQK